MIPVLAGMTDFDYPCYRKSPGLGIVTSNYFHDVGASQVPTEMMCHNLSRYI